MVQKNAMKVILNQQFFEDVKPILILSRIFGLSPVQYEKVNGGCYRLNISYMYVAYSYILGLLLAVSSITGLVLDIKANPQDSLRIKDTTGAYVVSCDLSLMILIVILGIFISPFKINKLLLILESLNHVQLKIPSQDKKNERKHSVLTISIILGTFLMVLIYDFIGWCIQTENKPSAKQLWKNFPVYFLYIVSVVQELFYWHITYFMRKYVKSFNECLNIENKVKKVEFIEPERLGYQVVQPKDVNQVKPNISAPLRKMENCDSGRAAVDNGMTLEKAKTLTNVHRILFETVNLINDWYGIPLLLILLSCFLQLIGTPYFMLTNNKNKSLVFAILEFIWLFTHIGRLLLIVEASHRCLDEYEKINYLLCIHLEKDYDYSVRHQLKLLALQINTCKAKFTSYGIAEIRRSILASITGAVTTYLVILVQLNEDSIPKVSIEAPGDDATHVSD